MEIQKPAEDPKLINGSSEFHTESETHESTDPKTASEITGPENLCPENWSSAFHQAAKMSDRKPNISKEVSNSLQEIMQFDDFIVKFEDLFSRTMGGANLLLKLTKLIEVACKCPVYGEGRYHRIPALILSPDGGASQECSEELRSFESFVKENYSEYQGKNDLFYSISAVKTDDDKRFFILWHNDATLTPIFVPFQDGCKIFERFLSELNPSESLDPIGKEMVQALISFERKKDKKRVHEMPHSAIQAKFYEDLCQSKKIWKNGFYKESGQLAAFLSFGESSSMIVEVLYIKAPGTIILNVGFKGYKYIFAFREGENTVLDLFVEENAGLVAPVNDVKELNELLKKRETEKALRNFDSFRKK
eukprot:GHVP01035368.1.p1 GENE.GHVP01035368.1~~GHVP01035368.1.p1  ORF type:complete len:363 (+),score=72.69 GHVP01035368.1:817-1905(+)